MKRIWVMFIMLPLAFLSACGEHVVTDEFGRTEIVLAVIDSQAAWRYREEVNAFNKDNKEYFITVVDYLEGYQHTLVPMRPELGDAETTYYDPNWAEAYREAKKQLDIDLTVRSKDRKTPDILIIRDTSEYHEYARAGVLADLSAYYQRDIDETAVFVNAFEALKVEGKLYGIAPSFSPYGLYMDKRFAGLDMSLEAMIALQKEADYPLLGESDRMASFQEWLRVYQDEFIDWERWSCDFANPDFIALLEIALGIAEDSEETQFDIINKAIREQKPVFVSGWGGVYTYQAMSKLFGGEVALADNQSGENTLNIYVAPIYTIAANSRHKEGAWAFIGAYVSEEYQRGHVDTKVNQYATEGIGQNLLSGVPISRGALELVYEDGLEGRRPSRPERPVYLDYEPIEVRELEPAVVEGFRPILERDMRLWFEDETIQMIIEEEVAAYFAGHISQDRLIENLNNRVQLYLNEVRP